MGRGRQKAKHTKVARELKYFSPQTDLSELERELNGKASSESDWPEYGDYDQYADYDSEDEEDED